MALLSRLKGKNKFETIENYSIASIFLGVAMLSVGLGLNIISTKGITVILAMVGALISFVSTVVMILAWLVKEFKETS
ncbi:MAG: hypothetical protein HYS62_01000 [Candidatus Aenigmarchaeota archaeon]|nr:hypothetical protein [Candidatus Aenigmarchaeota archaeon]